MTKFICLSLLLFSVSYSFGQNKDKKEKKSVKEVLNELPEMLIAQPDAGVDTNANKLIDDNMSIIIPPIWRDKGVHTLFEFKLVKTDKDPLKQTFPLQDKSLSQSLIINMGTVKKSADDKKNDVLKGIKNHISAYYKETGASISSKELSEKTNATILSSEAFTTNQGKQGEIYLMNDIQTTQSDFIILLLIPDAASNTTSFVQFTYTHYTYETDLPEDMMEQKLFVYPDDQQTYVDFTKGILKTLRIQ